MNDELKKAGFREKKPRKTKVREHHFSGFNFSTGPSGLKIHRERIDLKAVGDYGSDPLGDGTFRMVPSGDVVDFTERNRRLKKP